ncbi:MAG: sulfatase [Candidatus Hodarchaeota archaeon]
MKPNIVIIVLDAVRAQNLPFYGYHRNTTPFLSSMEKDLAIYENAISSSYWTMPSIASLFTGMYTSGHGLVVDGDKLDESLSTLPRVLQRNGYRCAAFVRNVYVSEYSGLNASFHDFHSRCAVDQLKDFASIILKREVGRLQPPGINRLYDPPLGFDQSKWGFFYKIVPRLADVLMDSGGGRFVSDFAKWLAKYKGNPFFVYFHFLETHSPYRAPRRFATKFLSLRDNLKKLFINHNHLSFLTHRDQMTLEDFHILVSAYDNSILYIDYLMGGIVSLLKKNRAYDNTLLIVLSDHGDNIGDHGLMFHYWCLYDTLIRIPLLVKFPFHVGLAGRISKVVQNVDIFPTVLSILGEEDEEVWEQVQGNDLLEQTAYKREPELGISELVKVFGPDKRKYKELFPQFDRRLLSVRTSDRKFIYSSREDHEFYDLLDDPSESRNLFTDGGNCSYLMEKAFKYYRRMDGFYQSNRDKIDGDQDAEKIDESVIEHLKSLGYM